MKKIEAKIIADSINQQGERITTCLLTFPRFILAELNTHRIFSKNSASSRAIPFKKMVEMVETDPFIPIAWQKDHKGMQGAEYVEEPYEIENRRHAWIASSYEAIKHSQWLNNLNVTKQLCNRLLEPFMWHTVLLTGTEFKNFFELRCPQYEFLYNDDTPPKYFRSKKELSEWYKDEFSTEENPYNSDLEWLQINSSQAEIHMQALAEAMWDAMNESTPKELEEGEWHIPFGENMDEEKLNEFMPKIQPASLNWYIDKINQLKIKISTARCARLSYMTFDGKIDYKKDLKLHDTLLESQHMSPFEHCARTMSEEEYGYLYKSVGPGPEHFETGWCNNYRGFIQYRYLIEKYYDGFKI